MAKLIDTEDFNTFVHHKKFFIEYQCHKRRRLKYAQPDVHVRYGPTGYDKTRYVYANHEFDEIFKWEPGLEKWFDGYEGQKVALLDEYRGDFKFGMLLSLLDGYPCKVQIKGGSVDWSPTTIYITSPKHPKDWYPQTENDDVGQLLRRLTSVTDTTPPAPSATVGSQESRVSGQKS